MAKRRQSLAISTAILNRAMMKQVSLRALIPFFICGVEAGSRERQEEVRGILATFRFKLLPCRVAGGKGRYRGEVRLSIALLGSGSKFGYLFKMKLGPFHHTCTVGGAQIKRKR